MGYAKLQLNLQRLLTLEQARDYMGYPVMAILSIYEVWARSMSGSFGMILA